MQTRINSCARENRGGHQHRLQRHPEHGKQDRRSANELRGAARIQHLPIPSPRNPQTPGAFIVAEAFVMVDESGGGGGYLPIAGEFVHLPAFAVGQRAVNGLELVALEFAHSCFVSLGKI